MPSHDIMDQSLVAALQEAFGPLVEDEHIDIAPHDEDRDPDTCEVQADAWTLVLEGWPLENAWIVVDDDPEAPEQFRTALESTLSDQELAAMETLNVGLSGALATALDTSGDGLSMALSALLGGEVEQPDFRFSSGSLKSALREKT